MKCFFICSTSVIRAVRRRFSRLTRRMRMISQASSAAAAITAAYLAIGTSVLDLVGLQFISDGLDVEPKLARSFRLVMARLFERFQDELALRFCCGYAERQDDLR